MDSRKKSAISMLFAPGDWDERLLFKDYLMAHLETAAEYTSLKRVLFGDLQTI